MDIETLLDGLNDAQREAVAAPVGNLLVLAGAGSGKTRVLTQRISWLVHIENCSPMNIFAVTFTNKAAAEMRGRIEAQLGVSLRGQWIGTFHGLAHRFLRTHWSDANLSEHFQIMDSDDQLRFVKRIIREQELDEDRYVPRQVQWFINAQKDKGLRAAETKVRHQDFYEETLKRLYERYEDLCNQSGVIDFAEILLRTQELLNTHPEILAHYHNRFKHILIDEFQDTNAVQYRFIKTLAGNSAYVMAVGDDDQSIYSWRGAQVENIQRFPQDFAQTFTARLEQNYRSTGNILAAANALISKNSGRLGKNLWTSGEAGEPISIYAAFNEQDEARFIVNRIKAWCSAGGSRSETAILYRSNAQSRVLEEALLHENMPYRIHGGQRFFERSEIKDALAYLRLLLNPADDSAFERVINTPTRGIGDRTVALLREAAREGSQSLWQTLLAAIEGKTLSNRALSALQGFVDLIGALVEECETLTLHETLEHVVARTDLLTYVGREKGERGIARRENLQELIQAASDFTPEEPAPGEVAMPEIESFLTHASLEAGEHQGTVHDDCVQLMTLHSAKGLEFPQVFVCGMEQGLFPHKNSLEESGRFEEERRLCYVGITRAKKKLTFTYAEVRRLYGTETYNKPSQFLQELPRETIEDVRSRNSVKPASAERYQSAPIAETSMGNFTLGQRVFHKTFGEGTVVNFEGNGAHARVQVNFTTASTKWLVISYANLEPA